MRSYKDADRFFHRLIACVHPGPLLDLLLSLNFTHQRLARCIHPDGLFRGEKDRGKRKQHQKKQSFFHQIHFLKLGSAPVFKAASIALKSPCPEAAVSKPPVAQAENKPDRKKTKRTLHALLHMIHLSN
jgi:hypothetical protein